MKRLVLIAVVLSLSGCATLRSGAGEMFWLNCGLTHEPQECLPNR